MKKEYLPSKQFIIRLVILVIIIGGAFSVYKLVQYFRNRSGEKAPTKLVVKDIVQKDSNKNGIPDWEESLWGLDPSKDGVSNKEFILAQRAILSKDENRSLDNDSAPVNDNEAMSREFFAIIMSLQQTGNLDDASLKAISDTIGEQIVATPIPDIYKKTSLVIKADGEQARDAYFANLKDILLKYQNKDIGNELTFISQGIEKNDPQAIEIAKGIGESYKSFGRDLVKISVPNSLAQAHLNLANNYEKTGRSIDEMVKVLSDQMAGMKGLINYNKYSDDLVVNMQELSDNYY